MKKFLRNHLNTLLVFSALFFICFFIAYFTWGIGYIIAEIDMANKASADGAQATGFDLKSAAALDYRGLAMPVSQ